MYHVLYSCKRNNINTVTYRRGQGWEWGVRRRLRPWTGSTITTNHVIARPSGDVSTSPAYDCDDRVDDSRFHDHRRPYLPGPYDHTGAGRLAEDRGFLEKANQRWRRSISKRRNQSQ